MEISETEKKSTAAVVRAILPKAYDSFGSIIILLFIVIIMSWLSDSFLSYYNIINVIKQTSFTALIALGMMPIIVTSGIDLSFGSLVGLISVTVASYAHPGEYPLIVPILICIAIGGIVGLCNGTVIAKTGLPPFIVTLGAMSILNGVKLLYSGGLPVANLSPSFIFMGAGEVLGIPVPVIVLVVVAVLLHLLLNNTRLGRHIYAIGGNESAAIASGINVFRVKVFVYVMGGILTAVSGMLLTARIYAGQASLGYAFEFNAIIAAVVGGASLSRGGVGTVAGTIIGALIVQVINNGMDLIGVSGYWQQIARGIVIVLAVMLDVLRNRKGQIA